MTREEIIEKAKYVRYPNVGPNGELYYPDTNINHIDLPIISNSNYSTYKSNEHHFTTKYHREYVLPTLKKVLDFEYNENDFIIVDNLVRVDEQDIDLSYLFPKPSYDKHFRCRCLYPSLEYEGLYKDLMWNSKVENITWKTDYHKLFAFPHLCSIITNQDSNNNRRLLVLGDSQSIPDISILCYYFKEVWYIDNRYKKHIYDKYILPTSFDDVIIISYEGGVDDEKYKKFLV